MNEERRKRGFAYSKTLMTAAICALFLSGGSVMAHAAAAPVAQEQQQTTNVTVTVVDSKGEPIIGANVVEKGTTNGTITDVSGKAALNVKKGATLQVSFVGFKTQEVKAQGSLRVVLRDDNELLDEVVVVGYGTQKKANLTGAVSTVDVSKTMEGRPQTDVMKALQGAVPGLTITNASGDLDADPTVVIRGIGTLSNSATSTPLYIVDGVPVENLGYLNPNDIESISVLKDASSTSIYGTRAAFGVVLVTTKSAKTAEKVSVTYSNNFAWSHATALPDYPTVIEQARALTEANVRAGLPSELFGMYLDSDHFIEMATKWQEKNGGKAGYRRMIYGEDYDEYGYYADWDVAGILFNNATPSQQHNLSVSGNSGKTNYYMGLSYMGQGGVVKVNPDSYNRFSVNYSTDTEIKPWLKVRSKALYTRTDLETPFNYGTSSYDALYYLYRWPVTMPYGTYEGHPFRNSVTETAAANMDSNIKDYMRFSVGATFVLGIPDLTLDIDYTYNLDNQHITQRGGTVGGWDFWSGGGMTLVENWAATSRNKVDKYQYNRNYHAGNAVLRYKHT